ncbi:MAG: type I restriction endonuclease subunit R, partial [Deltaproteobacteria bacterium]|nr:type I restriction endonuclease subunit R [Deltaproteobacteria bacterium]
VKSFMLHYIDWEHPGNNAYHVTAEFPVERTGSHETRRPDIVLFVNGIPLVIIECKRPDIRDPMDTAIKQQIRNQKDDEIPRLFLYSQILLALSGTKAMVATTGTPVKFWAIWREDHIDRELYDLINQPLSEDRKERLFSDPFTYMRPYFDELEAQGPREVTEQDRIIYALCRPERLLELVYRFILYEAGEKKIARYQQYFCVKEILERITAVDHEGRRRGGVVWHTQGSGKSLTMVMLAKAIALKHDIPDHKIVLVTDRVDLDDQIYTTFLHCGKELTQAKTGKHLIELVEGHKERIITTVIDKFDAALGRKDLRDEDPNIFVLVDESHRTHYGRLHAHMRKVLPNACFIGFTGTPVMKKDKNTILKFGGLIQPAYTITQAVNDRAVVPLLYEGRDVALDVQKSAIDDWFKKITLGLTREQQADLKKKFARADQLNRAEQKIMAISWDISTHFVSAWKGTGFKAQLVADRKATALRYRHYLNEFDLVTCEVLISAPSLSEGEDDIYGENTEPVERFWKSMMDKYGTEKEYNRQLINAFKNSETLEVIIVVDKLLTGFDAPRNTVLYLTKKMEGHGLLQAIARVNRLYEGKDFGYVIDYYGVLAKLGEALDLYGSLAEFDEADLYETLTDVGEMVKTLPQKHSDLWDIFKGIGNRQDIEAFEQLLADEALRKRYYERLSLFARGLSIALSTLRFNEETPGVKIERYRTDLKFFMNLRTSVRRRYAEAVDFKEYEKKIQKLIDTHVGAGEVEPITPIVNIFDPAFEKEIEKVRGAASKADSIAHRTKKTISEKWMEDPAFYKKFSEMLEEVIRAYRQHRLSDAEYLHKVKDIM